MNLTVAICTWNRAELLDQTLRQMAQLKIPANVVWEVLVVNNNCTDHTDEVIDAHKGSLPLRRLFEPVAGQSRARNLAISEAAGDYIVWTDDDVLVSESWLVEYLNYFAKFPAATIFGGPIQPWFQGEPPRWLQQAWQQVSDAYAIRELGAETFEFDAKRVPFGANFALRIDAQRVYLFDPELGLKGMGTMRGDETTLIRRMLADGHTGRWVPEAKVSHYIPVERQSINYLRGFFCGQGEYLAMNSHAGKQENSRRGVPKWLWRKALTAELKFRCRRLLGSPEAWVNDLMRASLLWGHINSYEKASKADESK